MIIVHFALMKKVWISLLFISFALAGFAMLRPKQQVAAAQNDSDSIVRITADSLFIDSVNLRLSLKEIPPARSMHQVARFVIGPWAKIFTVIKLQESGADGKNSYLAKEFNNLTGMRMPGNSRPTTAIGKTKTNYAIFSSWYDCMVDFDFYLDQTLKKFREKLQREPKDEYEIINFMYGSYNPYSRWKKDIFWLLKNYRFE
jgi:hypothetical protein